MIKHCAKCNRVTTTRQPIDTPAYSLVLRNQFNDSVTYLFCSAGCLQDWVSLQNQGLIQVQYA